MYGFKVSKPGKDVLTSDEDDLIFSDSYNSLKASARGSGTITTNGSGAATKNIAHGLGYIPTYRLYMEVVAGSGKWFDSANLSDTLDPANTVRLFTRIDATNLTIQIDSGAASTAYKYYYFLFYDQGS